MEKNKLFRSDILISKIGFGCWGIGSDSYGDISESKSIDVLDYALSLGINFYDTSSLYGNRLSEKRLGKFINKNKNKDIVISTKAGLLPHSPFNMKRNFNKAFIEKSINKSLKLLNKNIDILFLHSPLPDDIINNDKLINFLIKKKELGDIKLIGLSADSPNHIIKIIKEIDFDIVQTNFNLMDQRIIDLNLVNSLFKKKINLVARTPLAFGFLSGNIDLRKLKIPKDHRKHWSNKQLNLWNNGYKKFSKTRKDYNLNPAQFAINFCSSFKEIQTTIPGMMTRKDVIENIIASYAEKITKEHKKNLYSIYKRNNFFIK